MEKNYNYNYENRSQGQKLPIGYSNLGVSSCTSKVLRQSPVTNGSLWHTTDTNEFYYDWNGKRIKLNLTGDSSSISAELEEIKAEIAKLDPNAVQQKVDILEGKVNTAVSTVNNLKADVDSAVKDANSASQVAQDAAAQVANKVDANYVDNAIASIELTPGPKGDKGDAFTYDDFTPEQLAALKGVDGKDGQNGKDGVDGQNGADGKDGKSAFDIAKENGFVGTKEEWLESLKGEGLSAEDKAKIDSIPSDLSTGSFPENVDDKSPQSEGYATVRDVMDYVNALIEKKKGELTPSGEVKDYLYVNGVKIEDLNNSPTPTSIYQMNQYEINEDILTNGIIVLTDGEANGFYGGDGNIATIYSVVFAVEYPQGYTCKVYKEDEFEDSGWALQDMVSNPRYQTKMYGSKTYVCKQRKTISAGDDGYAALGEYSPYSGATDAQVKYKITLNKNQ